MAKGSGGGGRSGRATALSVSIGGTSLSVGSTVRLVPSRGDDNGAFGRVVEVNPGMNAVRVEAYRGKRSLPRDSGWYQAGRGLFHHSGDPYLAAYNRSPMRAPR